MMVMIAMYVADTAGLTGGREIKEIEDVKVFPNPMTDRVTVVLPPSVSSVNFTLFDILGRIIQQKNNILDKQFEVLRGDLPSGLYVYRIENKDGRIKMGKILME